MGDFGIQGFRAWAGIPTCGDSRELPNPLSDLEPGTKKAEVSDSRVKPHGLGFRGLKFRGLGFRLWGFRV